MKVLGVCCQDGIEPIQSAWFQLPQNQIQKRGPKRNYFSALRSHPFSLGLFPSHKSCRSSHVGKIYGFDEQRCSAELA